MDYATPIRLVFMLEEPSARHFLDILMKRILSGYDSVEYQLIPHQGKSDLQQSIPRKLRAWRTPNTFFIILHDQDNHDCKTLKQVLRRLCTDGKNHDPLIRIACRELEAWYFGDLDAVEKAFPGFKANQHKNKSKFREPDNIARPSKELQKIVSGFSKSAAARRIPEYMDVENNTSASFNHFISGIRNLLRRLEVGLVRTRYSARILSK